MSSWYPFTIQGTLLPSPADTYSLGGTSNEWKNVYVGTGRIYFYTDQGESIYSDGSNLLISAAQVHFDQFLVHAGDTNTYIAFSDDEINLYAGGIKIITFDEAAQDSVNFNTDNDDIDVVFNNDTDTTLTINGSTAPFILVDTDKQLQFRDSAIYIASLTDGRLDLTADVAIDVNSPLLVMQDTSGVGTGIADNDVFYIKAWDKDGGVYTDLIGFFGGVNVPYMNIPAAVILQFRDSGISISSVTNGHLDVTADIAVDINSGLVGAIDAITATSETVASSLATVTTEVTTNGDTDLDIVSLANGLVGQIKVFTCVVEGAGGDTWKVTPATMNGGTQITFTGAVGEGCSMVYNTTVGWTVFANNGGTVA